MSTAFKKLLLTGTALVAAAAFSTQALAAAQTLTSSGTWGSAGTFTGVNAGDASTAAAGDAINLGAGAYTLTVTNNGTANDGSANKNTFSLGAVTDGNVGNVLSITTGSANAENVTVGAVTLGTSTAAGSVAIANGFAGSSTAVTFNSTLSTTGGLTIANTGGTASKTVAATVTGALTVAKASTITAGALAGADATLTLNGAGANAFTLGVTLDDGAAGLATLKFGGTAAQSMASAIKGAAAGEGTLTSTNSFAGGGVTFGGNIGAGGFDLKAINAGVAGTTTIFNGTVNATTTNVTGTGEIDFNAATGTNVAFGANDGVVKLGAGLTLTGTVDATTADKGTLTLVGAGTVTGAIGATQELKVVNTGVGISALQGTVHTKALTTSGAAATTVTGLLTSSNINIGGTGTVTLNGAGTNTGATVFSAAGTLALGAGANLTGAVTTTAANGTLTLLGASTVTGTVGGTGHLLTEVKAGAGASVFTGAVSAATFTVNGANTIALQGGLTGTTLAYGANASTITVSSGKNVDAAVTGSAGVLNLAGGTQSVTGSVGAITELDVGQAGGATTLNGTVAAVTTKVGTGTAAIKGAVSGVLKFTGAGTATVDNGINVAAVDGTGAVGAGTGTLVFSGTSTAGAIGAGGVLKAITLNGGSSTVQKTVTTGAVTAADTINLNGNVLSAGGAVVIGAGQTLNATIYSGAAPANYGHIAAIGATKIDVDPTATVNLTVGSTAYIPTATAFVIADAGAASTNTLGATKLVVNGVASVAGVVHAGQYTYTQTANANDLIITATRLATSAVTSNANSASVGATLDALGAGGGAVLQSVQGYIAGAGSVADLDNRLSTVTPTVDGGATTAAFDTGVQVQGLAETRLAYLRTGEGQTGMAAGSASDGGGMWLQAYGQSAKQNARSSIAGYDSSTLGGALGFDTGMLLDGATVGVAINYGKTSVDSKNLNTTSTDVDSYGVNFYATHDLTGGYFVNGQVGYAYNDINSDRHNVGGAGVTAHGDYHSDQYSAKALVGSDYHLQEGMVVTPTASVAYTGLYSDGYTETGPGANLNVSSDNVNALDLGLGISAAWKLRAGSDGSVLKPSVHAGYTYDVIGDKIENTASFTGGGAAFKTTGADPARSKGNIGAGVTFSTVENWDLSANYDYSFRSEYSAHSGYLRATTRF